MKRVFLSSTARDLQEYRDAVFAAIQACDDLHCVRMEDFGARAEMADEFCRAKVAECDVFVGIVGHYFGSSPKGSDKSYTQQEYDVAVDTNKPRLMFIAPADFPIPANLVENASKRKRQREFRAAVNGVLRAEFKSPQDLATKVVTAIRNWERDQEQVSMEQLREQYLAHVIGEWEKIRLIGFSHAGKAVDDPKLEQVFVPLHAERQVSTEQVEFKAARLETDTPALRDVRVAGEQYREAMKMWHDMGTREKVSLTETLTKAQRMVVLGAPGAGKSTLLQWLALSFARGWHGAATVPVQDESCVPLRIVLREFARERSRRGAGYAVENYLHDYYRERGQNFPPQFFTHFIKRGQCALLFDGMDEVGASAQRIEIRDLIENLARAHPGNRFIVTSRPKGYEAAPLDRREFYTFGILDFDDDAIRQFIENWYRAVEGKHEPEAKKGAWLLSKSLEANPNVKRLAVNPLMLAIIATIHRTERLPNQRVRLYDKCTESLLVKWDEVRGVGSAPIGEEEQRRRLEHIAYWMHNENIGDVERDELQRKLTRFLKPRYPDAADEASRFIDRLVERAGILVERNPDRFAFVHRTFQEYFAAMDIYNRYLDEEDSQIIHDAVMSHLHNPRWEEVSLLTMAKLKVKPATKLLQAILSANSWGEDVLHRDLFFAARVLADDVMVEYSLAEKIIDAVAGYLLPTCRRDFLIEKGELHETVAKVLASLVRGVYSETVNAMLRNKVADELSVKCDYWFDLVARHGITRATELLWEIGRNAEDEEVRWKAAAALGRVDKKEQAAQLLLGLARTANDGFVRWSAITDLGKLRHKSESIIKDLIELARTSSDNDVRVDSAEVLGELGERSLAVELLLEFARTSSDERIRQKATSGLLYPNQNSEDVINGLADLTHAPSNDFEWWLATFALRELGEKPEVTVNRLLMLAQWAGDKKVRRHATLALGELTEKSEVVINTLKELSRTARDRRVRWNAVLAMAKLGENSAEIINRLAELARSGSDKKVRRRAIVALSKLDLEPEMVRNRLLEVARTTNDKDVSWRIALILADLGEKKEAVQLLLQLESATNKKARRRAIVALGELGEKSELVISTLVRSARFANDEVMRWNAAAALERLGETTQAAQAFLELAHAANNEFVRRDAAIALGRLGAKPQAVRLLLEFIHTLSSKWVRRWSTTALGRLGVKSELVIDGLLRLTRTADDLIVRERAAEALGRLGEKTQSVLDGLLDLARQDESAEVRDAAYESLMQLLAQEELENTTIE